MFFFIDKKESSCDIFKFIGRGRLCPMEVNDKKLSSTRLLFLSLFKDFPFWFYELS